MGNFLFKGLKCDQSDCHMVLVYGVWERCVNPVDLCKEVRGSEPFGRKSNQTPSFKDTCTQPFQCYIQPYQVNNPSPCCIQRDLMCRFYHLSSLTLVAHQLLEVFLHALLCTEMSRENRHQGYIQPYIHVTSIQTPYPCYIQPWIKRLNTTILFSSFIISIIFLCLPYYIVLILVCDGVTWVPLFGMLV